VSAAVLIVAHDGIGLDDDDCDQRVVGSERVDW